MVDIFLCIHLRGVDYHYPFMDLYNVAELELDKLDELNGALQNVYFRENNYKKRKYYKKYKNYLLWKNKKPNNFGFMLNKLTFDDN